MDAAKWHQIRSLFDEALEHEPETREAYLDRACPDPVLRREVDSLLAALAGADEHGVLAAEVSAPDASQAGLQVGPYVLRELLGRGGMGAVYLAERADGQFKQRVALKLVERATGGELVERLLAERRILARLEHPHIARLLGGGMGEPINGRGVAMPYLVMEYVDGVPITEYCAQQDASLEARLALFRQVCEAVQYAHRNLVVHRDLKPSNVLVTPEGEVKLLDFGIAKVLAGAEDDDETALSPLTRTGVRMLTPYYASPEQLRGQVVTTSSDVYALGVLLYEILTGHRPFDLHGLTAGEIERVVAEQEPTRPSDAERRTSGADTTLVRPSYEAARRLRGDLDQIVLKALRKEPERRYASAEALSDDVRRYLDGLPVEARPDTFSYRASKFVRRHYAGVAAAVVMLVLLVGGIVATTVQARRAEAEAEKAATVNTFLLDMLASADPDQEGREVTVAELLDAAAREADAGLEAQPATEAAIRLTLGNTYAALGLYDEADAQLDRALALRQHLYAPDHDDLAEAQAAMGKLMRFRGDYEAADSLFTLALATTEANNGRENTRTSDRISELGITKWESGDYDAAEPLLRESLALDERLHGPDDERVATSLGNLATLLSDLDRKDEAEALYRRELAIYTRHGGEQNARVPQAISHIAILRHDAGALEEADSLHRRALALYRRIKGDRHPDVGYALNNLATVQADLGRFDEAIAMQREGIDIYREQLGDVHPNMGILYNNLGYTFGRMKDLPRGLEAYEQALSIWRASLPEGHPYLAYGLQNVAANLMQQNRPREAEPLFREGFAIRKAALPEDHPDVYVLEGMLGECLGEVGKTGEAEPLLREAYVKLREINGPDHPRTVEAGTRLTDFYEALGRGEEAARLVTPVAEVQAP